MGIKHSFNTAVDNISTIKSVDWNADHIITSSDMIPNLNSDLVDGLNPNTFLLKYKLCENNSTFSVVGTSYTVGKTLVFPLDTANLGVYGTIFVKADVFAFAGTARLRTDLNGNPANTLSWASGSSGYGYKTGTINASTLVTNRIQTITVNLKGQFADTEAENYYYQIYLKA